MVILSWKASSGFGLNFLSITRPYMKSPHNSFSLALHVLTNHLPFLPSPVWSSFWFTTKEKGERYHFEAFTFLPLWGNPWGIHPPPHLVRNAIAMAVYMCPFLAKSKKKYLVYLFLRRSGKVGEHHWRFPFIPKLWGTVLESGLSNVGRTGK